MHQRNLAFSIALGAMLTLGLLVGFSLSRSSAMASNGAPETLDLIGTGESIRAQDAVSTAHVVVRLGDNDIIVRKITFTQPISGLTALQLTGLDLTLSESGAVCAIEGVGCPADDCFCGCPPPYVPCLFWNYLYWTGDAWASYGVGAGETTVEDGGIEGYAWGEGGTAPPPAPQLLSAEKALDWLRHQQQTDGGFSSPNGTAEALMAAGANRIDASTWQSGGPSLLANMLSQGTDLANRNASGVGKLAVALAAQESCWPIGAMNPLAYYDPLSGTFSHDTLYQAWAILGTSALSETVPPSATQCLKEIQQPDGGWEWAVAQGTDTNSTALALQALVAAGEPLASTAVVSGLEYLENAQNEDGGFPYSPNSPWGPPVSDANSTAYVMQALVATSHDPLTGTWAISNTNPVSYMLSLQLSDGSFEWQEGSGSDVFATRQVIPALLHQPFPLQTAAVQDCYGISGKVVRSRQTSQATSAQGSEAGIADVTVWAQGASDRYFGTTISPTGAYTISVPSSGTYTLSPAYGDYDFTPTEHAVQVTGDPGDVISGYDFVGETRIYLPLIMRN